MTARIVQQNLADEFYTPERCYIIELDNTPGDPAVSVARARVEPGVTTRWHRLLGVAERYYIVSGHGLMEIGDQAPQTVTAGDLVVIPAQSRQRVTNSGTEDLVFLAICTPRFTDAVYEDVDDDAAPD